ncbi:MAG TPA: hypothetical protein EYG68_01970 [Leucothrix mucor]|nr:hypothetical protein [Leucothrix mucor]
MIREKKIMLISKRRIIRILFLIPALVLGLLVIPASYAENQGNAEKVTYGPVKGSDTLGKIVSRNYSGSSLSPQQIMTGILRANPDAFIGGNIHFLLRDSTLQLPNEKLIATINKEKAVQTIKEHYRYFKQGKTGNFKILPLQNLSTVIDKAKVVENTDIIISSQNEKKIKVDEIERLIQSSRPSKNTTQSSPQSKEVLKATKSNNTQTKTRTTNNAIKDIELESLKIKVSQLEKILSRRGLSLSATTNDSGKITEELQNTLHTQKKKIDQLEVEKRNKIGELEQLKNKIVELELSLDKMSQSLSNTKNTASGSESATISKLRAENSKLQKKLGVLQLELDKKTQEVVALNLDIKNSRQQISTLESKLLNTDKENAQLDQQIAAMEAKLAKIRQTPASVVGTTTEGGLNISPWAWLLPALFLLSVLGYLFKRSFSQSEGVLVTEPVRRQVQKENVNIGSQTSLEKANYNKPSIPVEPVPDIIASASEEESMEASIKLDIAKAYMDMDMSDAAIEILEEIPDEGSQKQCVEAKHLLDKLAA